MNSTKVTVCLSREAWIRYSNEAQARHIPLAAWVRRRLEEQDRLVTELTLRGVSEALAATPAQPASASSASEPGTLLEALLLLRSLAGPQTSAMAQAEVERQGLTAWKSPDRVDMPASSPSGRAPRRW